MARNNPPGEIFVLNPLTVPVSNTYHEENLRNKVKKVNIFRPVFTSFIAVLSSLANGMALGYPVTAIPGIELHLELKAHNEFQESWFISIFYLGAVPGALLSGWAMDKIGRRATIAIGTVSYVIGWTLLLCSGENDIETMYAGRFINGFSFATILPAIGVYISEISPPKIRGILMSFHQLGQHIGILFVNISGTFLSWRMNAAIALGISIFGMQAMMIFLPQTPRWLVMVNEKESAESRLRGLRGDKVDINIELQEIEESLIDSPNMTPWLDYMKSPLRKYFLICLCLFILQEVSRINIIGLCMVSIINEAKTNLNWNLGTIFLSLLLVAGSVLFTFLVEKRERRVFFLLSGMVMAFSLGAIGACIEFANHYKDFKELNLFWLQLLALAVASLGYVLGVGPLPYVITCEMFPNRARGRASSLGVATLCLLRFFTTKYLLDFRYNVGDAKQYFACAGICLVGFIIAYFVIPETKGKTLERIELDLFKQE